MQCRAQSWQSTPAVQKALKLKATAHDDESVKEEIPQNQKAKREKKRGLNTKKSSTTTSLPSTPKPSPPPPSSPKPSPLPPSPFPSLQRGGVRRRPLPHDLAPPCAVARALQCELPLLRLRPPLPPPPPGSGARVRAGKHPCVLLLDSGGVVICLFHLVPPFFPAILGAYFWILWGFSTRWFAKVRFLFRLGFWNLPSCVLSPEFFWVKSCDFYAI